MTSRTFKAVAGSRLSELDAVIIGGHLDKKYGDEPITAERLVQDAQRPNSPLHRYLEWDDTEAAHEYRLVQARELLRSIEVVVEESGKRTRAYLAVTVATGERAYVSSQVVWRTPELADQVRERLRRELLVLEERYRQYGHLAEAVQAVGAVAETLAA